MSAAAHAELVRRLYGAFGARDASALEALLADGVVWHVPGRNPLAGHHRGRGAVLAYLAALGQRTGGTFRAELIDVLASDSRAVALARATGQRGDTCYDGIYALVLDIGEGQVCEAWLMPEDLYALDAFLA